MTSTCNHRVCHPRMCVLCIPMLFIGTPVGDPLLALSSPNAPVGDPLPYETLQNIIYSLDVHYAIPISLSYSNQLIHPLE